MFLNQLIYLLFKSLNYQIYNNCRYSEIRPWIYLLPNFFIWNSAVGNSYLFSKEWSLDQSNPLNTQYLEDSYHKIFFKEQSFAIMALKNANLPHYEKVRETGCPEKLAVLLLLDHWYLFYMKMEKVIWAKIIKARKNIFRNKTLRIRFQINSTK